MSPTPPQSYARYVWNHIRQKQLFKLELFQTSHIPEAQLTYSVYVVDASNTLSPLPEWVDFAPKHRIVELDPQRDVEFCALFSRIPIVRGSLQQFVLPLKVFASNGFKNSSYLLSLVVYNN